MRLALISDLHANELALDAVLADARNAGYDRLVCLGDVATLGPRPSAVLARLYDVRCDCILGNHDEFMLDPGLIHGYSKIPVLVASVQETRETLSPDELAFIGTFERTLSFDEVFLYHGTPRSNMEDLLAVTPADQVDEMLGGKKAKVLAGGHTHLQMVRQHHGMLIVNSGSVGLPFRDYASGGAPVILPYAEYAIVDVRPTGISVDLRRVALEKSALAMQAEGWNNSLSGALRTAYS